MLAIQLVTSNMASALASTPLDSDPLRAEDALQEAQLVNLSFDAIESRVALLFDLRTALQLRLGNAGILVLRGVRHVVWSQENRPTRRTAWNAIGSSPSVENGAFDLKVAFVPDATLHVIAQNQAEFYEVTMDLPEQPPDYTRDDDARIEAGNPAWDKTANVVGSSTLSL
jgi:hypothetical protein